MPTYNRIEEPDRWDIVNYVRSLQGKLGAAPDTTHGRPGETGQTLPGASISAPTRPAPPPARLALYLLFNGALVVAVVWAARTLWRRRADVPPETAPIALFAALGIAVHLPPSASPRMLLPIVPSLIWIVALAVSGIAHRRSPPGAPRSPGRTR